jgi:hypothetical protein
MYNTRIIMHLKNITNVYRVGNMNLSLIIRLRSLKPDVRTIYNGTPMVDTIMYIYIGIK